MKKAMPDLNRQSALEHILVCSSDMITQTVAGFLADQAHVQGFSLPHYHLCSFDRNRRKAVYSHKAL